jgi:hypothetical protein
MTQAPVWLVLVLLAAAMIAFVAPGQRRSWLVWPTSILTLLVSSN